MVRITHQPQQHARPARGFAAARTGSSAGERAAAGSTGRGLGRGATSYARCDTSDVGLRGIRSPGNRSFRNF